MSLPWFRLYREVKDDPKLGELSDAEFRTFIETLCWACEKSNGGATGLTIQNANWAFRRNVTETLQKLFSNGLLKQERNGEIIVPKWDERQKRSDSSAERVRKHREKQKVTLLKQECNATEEKRVEEKRREQANAPALRNGSVTAFKKPEQSEMELHATKIGLPVLEINKFFDYYEANGWRVGKNPMKSWQAAMQNWKRNFEERKYESSNIRNSNRRPDRNEGTFNVKSKSLYTSEVAAATLGRRSAEVPKVPDVQQPRPETHGG